MRSLIALVGLCVLACQPLEPFFSIGEDIDAGVPDAMTRASGEMRVDFLEAGPGLGQGRLAGVPGTAYRLRARLTTTATVSTELSISVHPINLEGVEVLRLPVQLTPGTRELELDLTLPLDLPARAFGIHGTLDPDRRTTVDSFEGYLDGTAVLAALEGRTQLGWIPVGCTEPHPLRLRNLTQRTLETGLIVPSLPPELQLHSAIPAQLGPGASVDLALWYTPAAPVPTRADLAIATEATPLDEGVPPSAATRTFLGQGVEPGVTRTRSFTGGPTRALDLLIITDNDPGTTELHHAVERYLSALSADLFSSGVSLRVGVTSSDDGPLGPQGERFPLQFETTLTGRHGIPRVRTDGGHGMAVARLALSDGELEAPNAEWLRPDAVLQLLFVGHQDDSSPDSVADFAAWLEAQRPSGALVVHAAVQGEPSCDLGAGQAPRYQALAARLGGRSISPCDPSWSAALPLPAGLGSLRRSFVIDDAVDPSTLAVEVDGAPVAVWSFDAPRRLLIFAEGAAPGAGSSITVQYRTLSCP